ncbi:MAG TPA: Xaa-Pro aminopeptidase [Bacteroidales bacterium]|nr:M24 family metallopeptidase [Bacteroidales bacterium]HOU98614.1 Xaa-Pro aminopeptidase [Bacteroidales bacterium]
MITDKNQSNLKILFETNRKKLFDKLTNNSVAIFFSEPTKYRNAGHEYPYRQSSNIIYLTGIQEPIHSLWLTKDSSGKTTVFILMPECDERTKIYQGCGISKKEIEDISGIQNVYTFNEDFLKTTKSFDVIYCDNPLSINNYISRAQDIQPIMSELRLIKEPEEINLIQNAIKITGNVFHELLKNVKTFKKESDMEAFITGSFIKKGNLQHAYLPIIAGGANALTLHYCKNNMPLSKNSLTLLDFGCEYNGYASDLSRTIPNNGKFNKRTKHIYNKVLEILNNISKQMLPGTSIKELNRYTNELMEKALIELNLLKPSDLKGNHSISPCKKYFPHGVSHFIGLDVHDCGNVDTILQHNMVLSCEPGIYIPEENIGIRLENDILIDSKPINLMKNIAIDIDEIEERMNQ